VDDIVTWNIIATNNGPTTVPYFVLDESYPLYTTPTAATLSLWTCTQNNACTYNGSTLLAGESSGVLPFSVKINTNIPLDTTQVCNSVKMTTLPDNANCFTVNQINSCAPVKPGFPDIVVKKSVYTSQYTFRVKYTNIGTGPVNNLLLLETLQDGWTLSQKATDWSCSGTNCQASIPNVPNTAGSNSGVSDFVVDVNPLYQEVLNGTEKVPKCWFNTVNSTFDDVELDPTPANNQASSSIGNSCQKCCTPVPCPQVDCIKTCPETVLITNCPPKTCKCEVPEFWCPTCVKVPPACDCKQCSGFIFA